VTANGQILNVAGGFYAASTDTGAHSALTAPGLPESSGAAVSTSDTPGHLTVMSDAQPSLASHPCTSGVSSDEQGLRLVWNMACARPTISTGMT